MYQEARYAMRFVISEVNPYAIRNLDFPLFILFFEFYHEIYWRDVLWYRQYIRWYRRTEREAFSEMWGESPEARAVSILEEGAYNDIFQLRKLFGEEPYEEEEIW